MSCWWNGKLYGANIVVETSGNSSSTSTKTKTKTTAKKISLSKTSLSVNKGKTATLKLKNATASKVKWTSSNKKIATVSSKGVVKGVKAGKATVSATYKGKKYKCSVTVKNATSSKQQAFNKVKNYILKNGEKFDSGANVFYSVYWSGDDGIHYELTYNSGDKMIIFQNTCYVNNEPIMNGYFTFDAKNYGYYTFDSYSDNGYASVDFKKSEVVLKNGFNNYEIDGGSSVKNQANSYLQWTLPEYNKKIKKLTGVTLKQLGFTKIGI